MFDCGDGMKYKMKLDIDQKMSYTKLTQMLINKTEAIRKLFNIIYPTIFETYKTHKGYHIYITTHSQYRISNKRIVELQLIYGSDPQREIHNLERIEKHIKNWNVLFNSKYKLKNKKGVFKIGKKISEEKYVGSFIY